MKQLSENLIIVRRILLILMVVSIFCSYVMPYAFETSFRYTQDVETFKFGMTMCLIAWYASFVFWIGVVIISLYESFDKEDEVEIPTSPSEYLSSPALNGSKRSN